MSPAILLGVFQELLSHSSRLVQSDVSAPGLGASRAVLVIAEVTSQFHPCHSFTRQVPVIHTPYSFTRLYIDSNCAQASARSVNQI